MNGASVISQPNLPNVAIGGSLAEGLFQQPIRGKIYCDECNLPIMEVVGGVIHLISRHHGSKHHNIIEIKSLLDYVK